MDLKTMKLREKHISMECIDEIKLSLEKDIPELIVFAELVENVFKKEGPEGTNDYSKGYRQCWEDMKREIYG